LIKLLWKYHSFRTSMAYGLQKSLLSRRMMVELEGKCGKCSLSLRVLDKKHTSADKSCTDRSLWLVICHYTRINSLAAQLLPFLHLVLKPRRLYRSLDLFLCFACTIYRHEL